MRGKKEFTSSSFLGLGASFPSFGLNSLMFDLAQPAATTLIRTLSLFNQTSPNLRLSCPGGDSSSCSTR
jgi:hypothetical protein